MPSLVARKRTKEADAGSPRSTWEVRAIYLPFFLSADQQLLQHIDQRLRERFKGELFFTGDPGLEERMSQVVMDAILEKYPIQGLREVLLAIANMKPEQRLDPSEVPNLELPKKEKPPKPELQVLSLEDALEER